MNKKIIYITVGLVAAFVIGGIYINSRTGNNNLSGVLNQQLPNSAVSTTSQNASAKVSLSDYGKAPDFTGIDRWLDSSPLTINSLKGKVVLIDFWTYSCINCIRTLPYVTRWYDTYKDNGLVVVGVHTPEFAFEKETNNVQEAIRRFNIHYPVAQDNEYATWTAYSNAYWPAEYLIDKNGEIVYEHFGEGEYDHTENAIRELLELNANVAPNNGQDLSGIGSPEIYFGTDRLENLSSSQTPSSQPTDYTLPDNLDLNNFALGGNWQFDPKSVTLKAGTGEIKLKFHSGKVYLVASSPVPASITITVDGKEQNSITVSASKLYTLFDSNDYGDHVLEIKVNQTGFQAFTFTFG